LLVWCFVIVLSRVDSRLIHGQVVEAWLPFLRVARVIVVDDVTARDPMAQAAMGLAVPETVAVLHTRLEDFDPAPVARDEIPTLVLFRDVGAAVFARARGLPNGPLTLGNVHAGPGRHARSRSVFLTELEEAQLSTLAESGMDVMIQSLPSEAPQRVHRAA
jgi:mannose/fructose/N-acetylgalactosamine-specific phosphotransferase system component IIB